MASLVIGTILIGLIELFLIWRLYRISRATIPWLCFGTSLVIFLIVESWQVLSGETNPDWQQIAAFISTSLLLVPLHWLYQLVRKFNP